MANKIMVLIVVVGILDMMLIHLLVITKLLIMIILLKLNNLMLINLSANQQEMMHLHQLRPSIFQLISTH